jgi:type IX secretion system PorP/SprF family membrane protein
MKRFTYLYYILLFTGLGVQVQAQDALTMQDINFNRINYNSAYFAEKSEMFGASLTSTSGGGIQNTGQVNFLAYSTLQSADLAIGIRMNSKYFGYLRTSNFELNTAKKLQLTNNSILMASIGIGLQLTSLRTGQFNEYVDQLDPIFENSEFPQYRFTFSFALAYVWNEKLKLGISLPNFAKTESKFNLSYVFNSSYEFEATDDLKFTPEILVFGSDIKPFSGELNVRADYKELLWLKLGYRTTQTFVAGMGVQLSTFEIGYSYNVWMQSYNVILPSTHNINLTFRIPSEGLKKESKGKGLF